MKTTIKTIELIFVFLMATVAHLSDSYAFETTYTASWPEKWGKYEIVSTPVLNSEEQMVCERALEEFLIVYPEKMLTSNLNRVTFLNSFSINHSQYRGTNHFKNREMFIVCRHGHEATLRTLHHEFSSILIWNNMDLFDFHKWVSYNPQGLNSYKLGWQGNGPENAKLGLNSNELDDSFLAQGFLTPYNSSSFINDFNRYAEYLFVLPISLKASQQYPRVSNKTVQIIEFYRTLGVEVSF